MSHETVQLTLQDKAVDIDKGMVSTILWMNDSFQRILTQYCCEGDELQRPYVLFYCFDIEELKRLISSVQRPHGIDTVIYARVEVQNIDNNIRYNLRFNSCYSFRQWKEKEGLL